MQGCRRRGLSRPDGAHPRPPRNGEGERQKGWEDGASSPIDSLLQRRFVPPRDVHSPAPASPGRAGAVGRQHIEDLVGHHSMPDVIGVHTVVMHKPVGVSERTAGRREAVFLGSGLRVASLYWCASSRVAWPAQRRRGEVRDVVGAEHDQGRMRSRTQATRRPSSWRAAPRCAATLDHLARRRSRAGRAACGSHWRCARGRAARTLVGAGFALCS